MPYAGRFELLAQKTIIVLKNRQTHRQFPTAADKFVGMHPHLWILLLILQESGERIFKFLEDGRLCSDLGLFLQGFIVLAIFCRRRNGAFIISGIRYGGYGRMRFEQCAELLPHLAPENRIAPLTLGEYPFQFQISGAQFQWRLRHCRVGTDLGINLRPSGHQFLREIGTITCNGRRGGLMYVQHLQTTGERTRLEEPPQPKRGEYHTQLQHRHKQ